VCKFDLILATFSVLTNVATHHVPLFNEELLVAFRLFVFCAVFFLPSECLSFLQVSLCTIVLLCYLGSLTTALPMMKEVDTDMPHKMWFE